MAINATKNEGTPRERAKTGNVQAVCTTVRDIGIQETVWQGKTKQQHKIIIVWEINQTIKEGQFAGKRMIQSQKYTLSMYDKALLRQHLEAWRGKSFKDEDEACRFDLEKLIGKNCLLNLVESDDGKYINIGGISPIIDGMVPMTPELKPDHEYKWIDELAAKAVQPSTDAESPQDELVDTGAKRVTAATDADIMTADDDPHAALKTGDIPF